MSQRMVKSVDCDLCSEKHERALHALGRLVAKLEDELQATTVKLNAAEAALAAADVRWAELVETVSRRTDQRPAKKASTP